MAAQGASLEGCCGKLTSLLVADCCMASRTGADGTDFIHIGGFTPWAYKYVDKRHAGVATEWETVQLTSAFNAYLDADACCLANMANAAFFQHYPLHRHYTQPGPPTLSQLQAQGYVDSAGRVVPRLYYMFYSGDYDAAAWLYNRFNSTWNDTARGTVPIAWAVDPELALRMAPAFDMIYSQLAASDRVVTGDSGAGYLNPRGLYGDGRKEQSGLPDGRGAWQQHNMGYYRQFDVSFTGFVINGNWGKLTPTDEEVYAGFSPDGIVDQV